MKNSKTIRIILGVMLTTFIFLIKEDNLLNLILLVTLFTTKMAKAKERILKARGEKQRVIYKGTHIRMWANFSI